MKKFLVMALVCVAGVTVTVQAKGLTDEQKALKKEMLEKYDTNKDGKLEKSEIAKMNPEDKAKWEKAFPHHHKKKGTSEDSSASSTNSVPAASK